MILPTFNVDKEITNSTKTIPENEELLEELRAFRCRYLTFGGMDINVLKEISRMERDVQSSRNKATMKEANDPDVNRNPLSLQDKLEELKLRHEEEMMNIDFKRDKMIAQRELKELELKLGVEAEAKIANTSKALILNQLDPVVYDPNAGFCIHW
jgi:hypothetical protein